MARRVILSIVSHGNQDVILENGLLTGMHGFDIVLRENIPDTIQLIDNAAVTVFIHNLRGAGFGANHNRNFELAKPENDDWFVICNPDITATVKHVNQLLDLAEKDGESIATPALWNSNADRFDDNVRPFPTVISLFLSFAGVAAPSRYSDDTLAGLVTPDWSSGAFIAFRAAVFRQLFGFDERYFMYMEDVDICRRAQAYGYQVRFYPEIQLIHNAARHNRRIFSQNFRYHLTSVIKYFLSKG